MGDHEHLHPEGARVELRCISCGHDIGLARIGFKSTCERCNAYLHSCVHCRLLDRASMSCRSHTTELVSDRTGNNYCEEFLPLADTDPSADPHTRDSARDRFDRLFGNDS